VKGKRREMERCLITDDTGADAIRNESTKP
jgi:hypothetical protein